MGGDRKVRAEVALNGPKMARVAFLMMGGEGKAVEDIPPPLGRPLTYHYFHY